MYLIREVFQAKPGKAKDLVKMFKQAIPYFEKDGMGKNMKVMTDIVSTYWTVVVESETDDMGTFFANMRSATMSNERLYGLRGRREAGDISDRVRIQDLFQPATAKPETPNP